MGFSEKLPDGPSHAVRVLKMKKMPRLNETQLSISYLAGHSFVLRWLLPQVQV